MGFSKDCIDEFSVNPKVLDKTINRVVVWDFGHYTTDAQLEEINASNKFSNIYISYPHIGGGEISPSVLTVISIAFQFIQGVGVEFIYDVMKWTTIQFLNIISNKKERPILRLEYNDQEITLDYGFALTDEQKEKVVDASIKLLLEKL